MKKSPLWERGLIVLLICGVAVFGRTDKAGVLLTATEAHGRIDCTMCHGLVASLDESVMPPSPSQHCRSCHDSPAGADGRLAGFFHGDGTRSCADCHSFHDPGMIEAQGYTFAPARSAGPASCVACHDDRGSMVNLSDAHLMASTLYHSNDPTLSGLTASETCLLCHAEGGSAPLAGLDNAAAPRFSRHRMHPIGKVRRTGEFRDGVRVKASFDPRIRLFGDRIECHTCHQMTSRTKDRLLDLGSPRALCLACHEFE